MTKFLSNRPVKSTLTAGQSLVKPALSPELDISTTTTVLVYLLCTYHMQLPVLALYYTMSQKCANIFFRSV